MAQEKIGEGFMGIPIGMNVSDRADDFMYVGDNLYGGQVLKLKDQLLQYKGISIDSVHYLALDGKVSHIFLYLNLPETLELLEIFTDRYGKFLRKTTDDSHLRYLSREWEQQGKYRLSVLFTNNDVANLPLEAKEQKGFGRITFADIVADTKIESRRRVYFNSCEVCEN
ncbi:hypothetical protein [Pontibacter rugosus]|uniref:Uncharacterized protein n=1 Tax=Pontibacter rugosus TaxID=1745966 RepID=A0ABW3SVE6_9BACT